MTGGSPTDRLRIEHASDAPGEARIKLAGELDLVTAPLLREQLGRHEGPVVLDLADVEFVDSTGLVLLMESARAGGIRLRRAVSPPVARLLAVTKTEQLFAWVD